MSDFDEQFLEQLSRARARLEGKEAYDDEAIANEFNPDAEVEYQKNTVSEEKPKAAPKEKNVEKAVNEPVQDVPDTVAKTSKENSERLSVIWGVAAVAIAVILSCLRLFVHSSSTAWQIFSEYTPFIGLVCGASSMIFGALRVKKNKKGTTAILLGLLAILIAVLI